MVMTIDFDPFLFEIDQNCNDDDGHDIDFEPFLFEKDQNFDEIIMAFDDFDPFLFEKDQNCNEIIMAFDEIVKNLFENDQNLCNDKQEMFIFGQNLFFKGQNLSAYTQKLHNFGPFWKIPAQKMLFRAVVLPKCAKLFFAQSRINTGFTVLIFAQRRFCFAQKGAASLRPAIQSNDFAGGVVVSRQ